MDKFTQQMSKELDDYLNDLTKSYKHKTNDKYINPHFTINIDELSDETQMQLSYIIETKKIYKI